MGFGSYASCLWAAGRFAAADGATISAEGCSAVQTAAGAYTVTLDQPIESAFLLRIGVSSHTAAVPVIAAVPTITGGIITTVAVTTTTDAGVATNAIFSIEFLSKR